jgi:cytochrome c biogenesis protein CcdA
MLEGSLGWLSALWFGILASVSPCGLATNIAAVAYIGKNMKSPLAAVWSGLFYALGRTTTYVVIGVVLTFGLTAAYVISNFLQTSVSRILGPILILTGMIVLELIKVPLPTPGIINRLNSKTRTWGFAGSFVIGALFALAFCPVSAALFFGGVIPLAVTEQAAVMYPLLFGLGTALPVSVIAVILAVSAHSVSKVFSAVTTVELWARRITGVAFIGVGTYHTLAYTLGLVG